MGALGRNVRAHASVGDLLSHIDHFATLLEHKLNAKWSLAAGYRYMFVDYRKTPGAVYNVVTSGAVLGATWNLK